MAIPRENTNKLEQNVFLLLLLLVTILFFYLLKPLFAPVFWACVVGLLFYPVQQRLLRQMGDRATLSALMTLLLCVVVAVIPLLLILTSVVQEGANVYARIESGELNPGTYLDRVEGALPFLQRTLDWLGMDVNALKQQASSGALAVSSFAAQNILSLGQKTFGFVFSLALMLYMTFFLLRDGAQLMNRITRALPVGDERERLLFAKLAEVIRATVKGTMVVAIVQGALGGFIFWILDIPSPTLWGVAMAIMSLIPTVGAALVWLPFAIYLFAAGEMSSALILLAYGVLVIGLADNLLRPLLVGRDTKLPDWLVLLSTIGGLSMFGINGFVMGPLIAAVFLVFWQIFGREYYQDDLQGDKGMAALAIFHAPPPQNENGDKEKP
jgi:predicted PurR-regulated permease PerM